MKTGTLEIKFKGTADDEINALITRFQDKECSLIKKETGIKGTQPSLGHEVIELIVNFAQSQAGTVIATTVIKEIFTYLRKKGENTLSTKEADYPVTDAGEKALIEKVDKIVTPVRENPTIRSKAVGKTSRVKKAAKKTVTKTRKVKKVVKVKVKPKPKSKTKSGKKKKR